MTDTKDNQTTVNDPRTSASPDTNVTQPRSRRVRGFVYFIRSGEAIKIGFSKSPPDRLAGLQTSHHEELTLLGAIKGSPDDERQHHQMFFHLQLRGEWFRAEPELLEYIESALSDQKWKASRPKPTAETIGIIKGLIIKRRAVGFESPAGHRYSNLIEQTLNYQSATGDQKDNLRRDMAIQVADLERIAA